MQAAVTARHISRSGRTVPMTVMAQGLVTENTAISADTITARTSSV